MDISAHLKWSALANYPDASNYSPCSPTQLVQDIPNMHVVCPTQITNWVPLDEAEDADYITIWDKN